MASSLSLYAHTPIQDALSATVSDAKSFFESKSFDDWKKGRESELKTQIAIVSRLNNVIKASGVIAETIARSRNV